VAPVGVEEYGYVAPDPLDPDVVTGWQGLALDRRTGQVQNITPKAIRWRQTTAGTGDDARCCSRRRSHVCGCCTSSNVRVEDRAGGGPRRWASRVSPTSAHRIAAACRQTSASTRARLPPTRPRSSQRARRCTTLGPSRPLRDRQRDLGPEPDDG
jgi:hypothetical protein